MDSLTQIALGSAVSLAVMGRHTKPWKAALAGAAFGTLPDLDVFIDRGDPIRNMTMHRASSHALLYLTIISPIGAWISARLSHEMYLFKRWWLAIWLVLITHPLLDTMTVYGTQLALPFTDYPFAVGSIFIIDLLYTLPLLMGVCIALVLRNIRGMRWNTLGLIVSTAYLAWSAAAQQYVTRIAQTSLEPIDAQKILVVPTAFNTVLWRVLVMTPDGYAEGFYSLLDKERTIEFSKHAVDTSLTARWKDDWSAHRMAWFSHGFFSMHETNGEVYITDLRMGMEPSYTFNFAIGRNASPQAPGETAIVTTTPRQVRPKTFDGERSLKWIWERAQGAPIP